MSLLKEEECFLIAAVSFIFAGVAWRYSTPLAGALMVTGLIYSIYRYQAPSPEVVEATRQRRRDTAWVVTVHQRRSIELYGNNHRTATEAWLQTHLWPAEIAEWMDAGCYHAELAGYLAEHGLTPSQVGPVIDELGPEIMGLLKNPDEPKTLRDPDTGLTVGHVRAIDLVASEIESRCKKRKTEARKRKQKPPEQVDAASR